MRNLKSGGEGRAEIDLGFLTGVRVDGISQEGCAECEGRHAFSRGEPGGVCTFKVCGDPKRKVHRELVFWKGQEEPGKCRAWNPRWRSYVACCQDPNSMMFVKVLQQCGKMLVF